MEILEKQLKALVRKMEKKTKKQSEEIKQAFQNEVGNTHPFNRFEFIMSHLIATQTIDLKQYLKIRDAYIKRNKYLYVYGITAPRTFGETWAQNHLNVLVPELKKPSKKYDAAYSGQYDFWYDGIKIEVKASRVVKKEAGKTLIDKAISSASKERFEMNFQQMKPSCCDVFVWIAVWTDKIGYWVLSSEEVQMNSYYSKGQHRGNQGEGQLWITDKNIEEFKIYRAEAEDILNKIIEKYNTRKEQK